MQRFVEELPIFKNQGKKATKKRSCRKKIAYPCYSIKRRIPCYQMHPSSTSLLVLEGKQLCAVVARSLLVLCFPWVLLHHCLRYRQTLSLDTQAQKAKFSFICMLTSEYLAVYRQLNVDHQVEFLAAAGFSCMIAYLHSQGLSDTVVQWWEIQIQRALVCTLLQ